MEIFIIIEINLNYEFYLSNFYFFKYLLRNKIQTHHISRSRMTSVSEMYEKVICVLQMNCLLYLLCNWFFFKTIIQDVSDWYVLTICCSFSCIIVHFVVLQICCSLNLFCATFFFSMNSLPWWMHNKHSINVTFFVISSWVICNPNFISCMKLIFL